MKIRRAGDHPPFAYYTGKCPDPTGWIEQCDPDDPGTCKRYRRQHNGGTPNGPEVYEAKFWSRCADGWSVVGLYESLERAEFVLRGLLRALS